MRALPQKMSAGRWLPAWWWLPALLWGGAGGYVVVSSVSWPLPEAGTAADELHSSSTEEALPALLEDAGGLWKQSYPASAYQEDAALGSGPAARRSGQGAAPSRMFSYRREGGGAPGRAGTARFLARYNTWGFVATRAAQRKVRCPPVPTAAGCRGHALPANERQPPRGRPALSPGAAIWSVPPPAAPMSAATKCAEEIVKTLPRKRNHVWSTVREAR